MPVVYGRHPVEEILAVVPEQVRRIVVDRADRTSGLPLADIRVDVDADDLESLCRGGNHQGIAAELEPFRYASIDVIEGDQSCVLVLDQVQDPHNLGAILRSAAAMGASAVVIPKDRSASVTDTVIRTSAGLAYRIPVVQVTNVARTLEQLRDDGYWIVGTVMGGESTIWDVDLKGKVAIVMGGEGPGIRRLVLQKCDFRARIPMAEGAESLNVSVAASIVLYEWSRQQGT